MVDKKTFVAFVNGLISQQRMHSEFNDLQHKYDTDLGMVGVCDAMSVGIDAIIDLMFEDKEYLVDLLWEFVLNDASIDVEFDDDEYVIETPEVFFDIFVQPLGGNK
ncbi:MAG: hypothetical protein R8M45_04455 [Ghiorsea sp.]